MIAFIFIIFAVIAGAQASGYGGLDVHEVVEVVRRPGVYRPRVIEDYRPVERPVRRVPVYEDHVYDVVDHDVEYVDDGYDFDAHVVDYGRRGGSGHRVVEVARPRRVFSHGPSRGVRRISHGISRSQNRGY